MHLKTLLFCVLTFLPLFCLPQSQLKSIDLMVQEIKANLQVYSGIEKVNSTDGSSFAYLKGNELKLITATSIEPQLEKKVEWYFMNGQLVYAETNWFDKLTTTSVFNEKCYFENEHLILWENTANTTYEPGTPEFIQMEKELIEYSIKLKKNALK